MQLIFNQLVFEAVCSTSQGFLLHNLTIDIIRGHNGATKVCRDNISRDSEDRILRRLGRKPRCHVCAHPECARVELMRVSGIGLDAIGAQFDLSRDSIWRHMRDHVSEADRATYLAEVPMTELLTRAADEGISLLDFLRIVRGTLMKQFQLAASANDRRGVAALAGKLNETLDLIGKLTGEMLKLSPSSVVNNTAVFVNSPIFMDLQSMLVHKLAGYPEALQRVVEGLQELEAKVVPPSNCGMLIDGKQPLGRSDAN
ncbi:hypothetical protein [Bradyrhizobium sp. JYMT SZCCT0428]|uniref:hypothetical protein n=1 Tax=Bradyrhizobium sp. JYMT SZCCT0428 TaxID=2807673 RepID=UPI001BA6A7B8|nr:hypothetical protein [Bradyrhizobium sp. JYMT SZCCT0428]MBR1156866.1 hypothetical protein [Bradyrhizobium sp. JYMT SZCCT0428]